MAQMSMNKAIHGAIRRDLDRFITALQDFPIGNPTRARQLGKAWDNFADQLTYHHTGEHEIAWPALESVGVSAAVLAEMDAEHATMADALGRADEAMRALAGSPSQGPVAHALEAMTQLRSVTLAHLDHEEAQIESVYLQQRDSPELQAMGKAFGKVSPARGGRFFAWLLDGATPAEETTVKEMGVPAPVLRMLIGVFGRGYRKDVASVWRR
jgi:hypothetical protein